MSGERRVVSIGIYDDVFICGVGFRSLDRMSVVIRRIGRLVLDWCNRLVFLKLVEVF